MSIWLSSYHSSLFPQCSWTFFTMASYSAWVMLFVTIAGSTATPSGRNPRHGRLTMTPKKRHRICKKKLSNLKAHYFRAKFCSRRSYSLQSIVELPCLQNCGTNNKWEQGACGSQIWDREKRNTCWTSEVSLSKLWRSMIFCISCGVGAKHRFRASMLFQHNDRKRAFHALRHDVIGV